MSDFSNCFSCDNKDLPVDGLFRAAFRCDEEGNVYIATVGNGSSPTPEPVELCVNVTYEELLALIQSETLVCGTYYTITDFATSHYLLDGTYTNGDEDYYTDPVGEPLTVLALSTSVVSQQAWSALHPEDIIIYDWNPDNFVDAYAYTSSNTSILVPDWKGAITYRKDKILNVALYYDWRTAMNRRWAIDPDAWNILDPYSVYDFVEDSGSIYMCVKTVDPLDTIDISDTEYWAALDGISPGAWVAWESLDFLGMTVDPLDYQDILTFQDIKLNVSVEKSLLGLNNIVFYNYAFDVNLGYESQLCTFYQGIESLTSGMGFYENFVNEISICSFGNYCLSNYISKSSNIIFGNNFSQNYQLYGELSYCSFENYCTDNIFIGGIYNSSFGNGCHNIIINGGEGCDSNTFLDGVYGITLTDGAGYNVFIPGFGNVDLSTATHPYGGYSCTFLINANGDKKVMYVDALDVVTVADATD